MPHRGYDWIIIIIKIIIIMAKLAAEVNEIQ